MSDDNDIWQYLNKMENSYKIGKIQGTKNQYQYVEFGGSDKKVYCNADVPFVSTFLNAIEIEYFEYFIFGTGKRGSGGVFWGKTVCLQKVIDEYNIDGAKEIFYGKISRDMAKKSENQKKYGYYYFKKGEIEELEKRIKMDLGIESLKDRLMELIDNGIKQIICHGAPGTGKTYTITKDLMEDDKFGKIQGGERINFVQFHPSYDYTDFVEGLRPVQTKTETETKTETTFVRVDGIFKRFCREVVEANKVVEANNNKKYAFVIDEINRADLSKVFGELMYCLEEGYRGEKNRITTQYSNLPTYKIVDGYAKIIENDVFKEGFYIPDNVVIIGMMNDIDRSVESFDFAMQRRFHWINVDADIEAGSNDMWKNMFWGIEDKDELGKDELEDDEKTRLIDTIKTRMSELNKTIVGKDDKNGKKQKLGEEYKIGHAYFKNFVKYYCEARKQDPKDAFNVAVDKIWKYAIEPVIKSYIRGKRNMDGFLEECENSLKGNTDEQSNEQ